MQFVFLSIWNCLKFVIALAATIIGYPFYFLLALSEDGIRAISGFFHLFIMWGVLCFLFVFSRWRGRMLG